MEVCTVQQKTEGPVRDDGGIRRIRVGALRVHNDHIQSGLGTIRQCRICQGRLAGVSAHFRVEPVQLAASAGVDEKKDAPLPSDDGAGEKADPMLWEDV